MINGLFFMYAISILGIVLGFIALLAQKVYIDANTNQPTEIEIPFLGKLKTNIPAIVFVFLGFAAAFYTFESTNHKEVKWVLDGTMQIREGQEIDWSLGDFTLIPEEPDVNVSEEGNFVITVEIEEGKSLQDQYGKMRISHPDASSSVNLIKEFDNYMNSRDSIIDNVRISQDGDKVYVQIKPLPFDYYLKLEDEQS